MNEDEKSYIKEIQEHLKNNIDVKSKFEINVHRSNILNDSLNQFKNTNLKEYLKVLYIFLIEEDGNTTEISIKKWINLITEEIIKPKYELFIQSNNKKYYPNTKSSIKEKIQLNTFWCQIGQKKKKSTQNFFVIFPKSRF